MFAMKPGPSAFTILCFLQSQRMRQVTSSGLRTHRVYRPHAALKDAARTSMGWELRTFEFVTHHEPRSNTLAEATLRAE